MQIKIKNVLIKNKKKKKHRKKRREPVRLTIFYESY